MLFTNLEHISSEEQHNTVINSNENVMVCCGRMGPMCVPVYGIMEELRDSGDYNNVKFYDMEFDIPDARIIRDLEECRSFAGLPFTVYYKNGKVAKATTSIQDMDQVTTILDENFETVSVQAKD